MSDFDTDIVIAGAGPAGVVAAVHLARAGVRVLLLEGLGALPQDLRASTFHPPTLEYMEWLGLGAALHAGGLKAPEYRWINRQTGHQVRFDFSELADVTAFPYRLQCEQWKLTNHAVERLGGMAGAEIRFSRRAIGFSQEDGQEDGHVDVHIETPQAIETVRARYLLACDGANSVLRKWTGIEFDGFTYEEKFLCLSTVDPVDRRLGDVGLINYMSDPAEWMVLLRAPSAWRVLVAADAATPDAELLSDARKDAVFLRLLRDDAQIETTHRTIYRVHQRVARQYRKGRVVLVGDAAHLNNPLGGFGMNAALHDVRNLCGKLISIVQEGAAADPLLDQYERQRRTVMHEFIQAQSMQNKRLIEMSGESRQAAQEQELASIAGDPVKRRAYLMRQSMLSAVAREREIA